MSVKTIWVLFMIFMLFIMTIIGIFLGCPAGLVIMSTVIFGVVAIPIMLSYMK